MQRTHDPCLKDVWVFRRKSTKDGRRIKTWPDIADRKAMLFGRVRWMLRTVAAAAVAA